MTGKSNELKTLEQLQQGLSTQEKLVKVTRRTNNLADAINTGDKEGLEAALYNSASVRDLLPLARDLYARESKYLREHGVAVASLLTDGMTYLPDEKDGVKSSVLPMTYPLSMAVHHAAPEDKMGWWKLNEHGEIIIGGHRQDEAFAVCGNQTFINNAFIPGGTITSELEGDILGADRKLGKPAVTSVDMVLIDSEGYHWRVNPGVSAHAGMVFNSSDQLPPVDCPILVKVPGDTKVIYAQSADGMTSMGKRTEVDQILPVIRTSHLVTRDRDMAYKLEDGGIICGRLAWTYP